MMKKLYAIIFILTLMVVDAIAQRTCGTDELHDLHMLTDANYAQSMLDNERFYQWVLNAPESLSILNGDTTYVIPVVIHVIHTGGAPGTIYNPADTTLQNMISYMNGVFAANYAGYPNTSNGGVRFPIRFELAQRKPDCSSTNGIIRYNASSDLTYVSNGVSSGSCSSCITDANLKLKARWPSDMYYNIYVVNKINQQDGTSGTFTAGYAQYPSLLGGRTDGTVILATQAKAGSETIVHELGHAFNLKHTFEGSTSPTNCPPTSLSGCTVDNDAVCDTDPHPYDLSCSSPTSSNPCMSNAPYGNIIYNIMSYYSCSNRFTAGQRTRFIAALHTHSRSSLWKSNMNLTSSGFTVRSTSNCNITMTNPNNTLDIGAHLFRIFGDTVSSGGYNSTGNLFYIDKTCNRIFDTIRSGQIYSHNSSVVYSMSAPARYAVWLDYNDDGQFSSTELLTSGTTNYNSSSGTLSVTSDFSGSYTIPSTGVTYCKPLRMRLMVDTAAVNSNSPGLNPCGPVLYGQIIDYAIVVMPATSGTNVTAASISLTAGTNPSCPNSSQTFTAITTPSNTGTVLWYVNGSLVSTGAVTYTTSSLAHGSVVTAKVAFNGTCGPDTISTNSITINRTTPVTPSVSIAMTAGSNPSCINTSLTFTATPTNAVGTTTYQWFVNGNAVGTGSTYTASNFANGDQVYVEMTAAGTCVSSATYQSSSITLQRTSTSNSISLNITQGSNPTCAGAALTLSAQMTSPGNAPTYSWYRNGNLITGATSATYVPSTYTNGDVFRVIGTSNDPCVVVSTDTAELSITVTPPLNPSVSIAITTGSNPSCQGDVVTYKATPSNQTNSPSYRWFVNGTFTGVTTDSFSSNALANGSVVRVEMTADGTCSPAYVTMSNAITQTVQLFTPVAQLQVPSGALPTCTYNSITFSATSTNGGTAPVYTWLLNGTTVGTGNIYTGTGFTNGDELALVVTSNAQCLSRPTDTAKQIISVTTPVNPAVSIALTAGTNPSCVGTSVTYTATPNGVVGSAFYDWKINGTSIGVTTPSFTSTGINDNDVISVEMYAGGVCVLPIYVTSNSITHNTYSFTPTVSISQFAGPNPACSYDFVTYRANYTYGGGNPTFAWYINGVYQANSNHFQFTTSGLNVGDVVSVEMTSNDVCAQPKLATDAINANINPVIPPVATIAITNGSNPSCVGVPVEFTASPTLNTSTPTYVWMVNGNPVGVTTATFTTSTLVNNDIVSVSMTAAGQCFLPMPVLSNQIWMDIYSILPEVSISQTIGSNPACDYDTLTFTATPVNGGSGPVFDWYVNGVQMGTGNSFTKTNFANKDQLSVRLTSNDVCAQPKLAYDTVEIDILPRQNPNIAIALTDGRIPGCEDSVLTFESTVSGSGTNPIVDWFVGTTSLLNNNPILSKANLPNGQEIYAVVTPVGGCFNYFSDTSNAILILNEPQSVQPKLSLVGHTLISDVKPPLMWYGPNGFISQVVTDTFNPTIQGDYYVISTSSPNCHSLPSNVLNIILNLGIVNYDMSTLSIYPNPTREKLTIDWNGIVQNQVDITVYSELGQIVHQSRFEGASTYQIDCSRLASGQYYIQIVDVNGEQGIAKFIVE